MAGSSPQRGRISDPKAAYEAALERCLTTIRLLLQISRTEPEIAYRLLAVQLRMLLCDRKREHGHLTDISLLPRLIPCSEFMALDEPARRLSLPDWLAQPVLLSNGTSHSIQEMIKTICERDGGAHVDPRVDFPLSLESSREMGEFLLQVAGPLADQIDEMRFSD